MTRTKLVFAAIVVLTVTPGEASHTKVYVAQPEFSRHLRHRYRQRRWRRHAVRGTGTTRRGSDAGRTARSRREPIHQPGDSTRCVDECDRRDRAGGELSVRHRGRAR